MMRSDHHDAPPNQAQRKLACNVPVLAPMVLVALIGNLAFALDDRGLHIAVIDVPTRSTL